MGKISSLTQEELRKLISESDSIPDIIRKLGLSVHGAHYRAFYNAVERFGIDTTEFTARSRLAGSLASKRKLEDVLVENSTYSRTNLKIRLLKEGLIQNECAICGIVPEWNGKPLSLQLDHINGINNDNRLENLRFLCPNCHSQTDTYNGRNTKKKEKKKYYCMDCGTEICRNAKRCNCCANKLRRKNDGISQRKVKDRPSVETLLQQVSELGYVGTGCIYGVSDNTIRKWIKS